jgi:hypothetical protein
MDFGHQNWDFTIKTIGKIWKNDKCLSFKLKNGELV